MNALFIVLAAVGGIIVGAIIGFLFLKNMAKEAVRKGQADIDQALAKAKSEASFAARRRARSNLRAASTCGRTAAKSDAALALAPERGQVAPHRPVLRGFGIMGWWWCKEGAAARPRPGSPRGG